MKRILIGLLIAALCLTGFAVAETTEGTDTVCNIENGSYIIRISDPNGDLGWVADEMAQDDSVVKLASAELVDDQFVVQYDPTGDGDVSVYVKHYTGIACDKMYGWDLHVEGGAVVEATGGSYTESGDPTESDPYLIGEWMEKDTQFTQMTITKNEGGRGWDVEIASPVTHGAYIFKTTIYYDCELNSFVYDKGKYWEVPITDSDEETELGEAKVAGTTGRFTFTGDAENLILSWYDDQRDGQEVLFERYNANTADAAVDYGTSDIYTQADMDQAVERIYGEFNTWAGCEMHSISYGGDAANSKENIDWLNDLREGKNYTECIEFLTDFHSPVEGGGAWEADTEYKDWQWWLARTEGGDWELITWGY